MNSGPVFKAALTNRLRNTSSDSDYADESSSVKKEIYPRKSPVKASPVDARRKALQSRLKLLKDQQTTMSEANKNNS